MEEFKSGFVSIVGRTNVGKSTLLNALVGEKIAAIANKTQTTRTAIKGIINRPHSQIVFMDTPGIHKPKTKLGNIMIDTAFNVAKDADVVLFMIEATEKDIRKAEQIVLERIKKEQKKVILIINKIDLVEKETLLALIQLYQKEYAFEEVFLMSATADVKKEELLTSIEELLPLGPAYYDIEEYTDQTARQLVEEIIREKALRLLQEEVPHGIFVEVEEMKLRKTTAQEDIYDITATIYCLRDSHKGIIIGKNGTMLKKIGTYARHDLEKMLQTKINLSVWVKVNKDWQDKDSIVKKFKNE